MYNCIKYTKKCDFDTHVCKVKVSEHDQELPQSHTADQLTAP